MKSSQKQSFFPVAILLLKEMFLSLAKLEKNNISSKMIPSLTKP